MENDGTSLFRGRVPGALANFVGPRALCGDTIVVDHEGFESRKHAKFLETAKDLLVYLLGRDLQLVVEHDPACVLPREIDLDLLVPPAFHALPLRAVVVELGLAFRARAQDLVPEGVVVVERGFLFTGAVFAVRT